MTRFKQTLRTLTGCNEQTATYIENATAGQWSKLRDVDTATLTDAQRRKLDALQDAMYQVLQGSRDLTKITKSSDVYDLMRPTFQGLSHEEVHLVLLNQSGMILSTAQVSSGGMTGSIVDPKVVMRIAIERRATRIILCHNHPSQSTRPSQQDIRLTQKIKHGAQLLDIELTDHIILTDTTYFSFLDEGML